MSIASASAREARACSSSAARAGGEQHRREQHPGVAHRSCTRTPEAPPGASEPPYGTTRQLAADFAAGVGRRVDVHVGAAADDRLDHVVDGVDADLRPRPELRRRRRGTSSVRSPVRPVGIGKSMTTGPFTPRGPTWMWPAVVPVGMLNSRRTTVSSRSAASTRDVRGADGAGEDGGVLFAARSAWRPC